MSCIFSENSTQSPSCEERFLGVPSVPTGFLGSVQSSVLRYSDPFSPPCRYLLSMEPSASLAPTSSVKRPPSILPAHPSSLLPTLASGFDSLTSPSSSVPLVPHSPGPSPYPVLCASWVILHGSTDSTCFFSIRALLWNLLEVQGPQETKLGTSEFSLNSFTLLGSQDKVKLAKAFQGNAGPLLHPLQAPLLSQTV